LEDNIKTDLKEREREAIDWILLVQDRAQWRVLVNMAINLRVS
jgi:hypothetical protein